jgi:PAS domain S-box-containing protein
MEKSKFIDSQITELLHNWTNTAMLWGSIVIVCLSVLDYLVTPENFAIFLLYRIATAALIFLLYLLNKSKSNRKRQHLLSLAAGVIVSAMVALMIAKFQGHESPYFAGVILIVFFVVGLTSLDVRMSIVNSLVIYSIYLLPILVYDVITNKPFFINANMFILATIFATVLLRNLIQQRFVSEFGLQFDIEKQRKQLEVYSTQLEDLVQERTKELSVSEKWHRSLFDNATDAIIVLNSKGLIVNVNKRTCELHGFNKEALIGIHIGILEVNHDDETLSERIKKILRGEQLFYETEHFRKNGEKILLEVSCNRVDIDDQPYIESFYRDITEKKKIQEQLTHSQKMESIGALAGGIAHNFNNILTAILGNAELLVEYGNLEDISRKRVENIEVSARKAGVMVSKLLSFARKDTHEILPMNLHDVVSDSLKLFEGVLDKRIGLKVLLCDETPIIEGDPNQLEQVIMNFMVNARDAMPDGGLITIKTEIVEFTANMKNVPDYITPGQYVSMTVTDTGSGIPPQIINRIFDPFFTTKEKGKGTGLGLATVYGIVKDHRGYIAVQSDEGNGTSFEVYLPLSTKTVQRVSRVQALSLEGSENILVVDDDREVLNLLKDILDTHGYNVMTAKNALSATDIFKHHANKIQLVITDLVMPLMGGQDLIKQLRDTKPDIKIIVISGYSDDKIKDKKMVDLFIGKPFEANHLLRAVRQLLDTGKKRLLY